MTSPSPLEPVVPPPSEPEPGTVLWKPWAIKKVYPGKESAGEFQPPLSRIVFKITLTSANQTEPHENWDNPPHFSLNLSDGGNAWQHIPLNRAGYGMKGELIQEDGKNVYHDGNITVGKNIIVCIMGKKITDGRDAQTKWWTDDKYRKLGWYLRDIWISFASNQGHVLELDVPNTFKAWDAPKPYRSGPHPNYERFDSIGEWKTVSGVFGMEHSFLDVDNYAPSILDSQKLLNAIRSAKDEPQPETTIPGTEDREQASGTKSNPTPVLVDVDMSKKPFRFSPPLHRNLMPVRVDLASDDFSKTLVEYFDERGIFQSEIDARNLQNLRLGRIIQAEWAGGMAAVNTERYGFRFLYNPSSVTIQATRNDSVIMDPRSVVNAVLSGVDQNFQAIQFKVLLVRIPDVIADSVSASDYSPALWPEDLEGLRKYGTHWDLEYLYRLCNGIFTLEDRGKTGDIGVIIPSNARLLLGPGQNHFGFVESVQYTDQMFSRDMVPTVTDVDIRFRRHVDMAPSDMGSFSELLRNAGLEIEEFEGEKSNTGTATPANPGGSPAGDSTPGNMWDAPVHGSEVSQEFGNKNSRYMAGYHTGVDFRGSMGTPVRATRGGTVIFAGSGNRPGWGDDYGNHIVIETGVIRHGYMHLSSIESNIKKGATVAGGEVIGKVGNTGGSMSPHLHYEERKDPFQYDRSRCDCFRPVWCNRNTT